MRTSVSDIGIVVMVAAAGALLVDHFSIHGYLFDVHDIVLQTESGRGYDSHEFFMMLSIVLASVFTVLRIKRR